MFQRHMCMGGIRCGRLVYDHGWAMNKDSNVRTMVLWNALRQTVRGVLTFEHVSFGCM